MSMDKPQIVLASASPARRKLINELKIPFKSVTSGYQEDMEKHQNPRILARHLALGKAIFIASKFPNAIIIGADTFITVGGEKIGKPATRAEAFKIIQKMSGQTIAVHSGIAVIKTDARGKITRKIVAHVLTKLKIKKMSTEEISLLTNQKNALKISGAFSIEGAGGKMVERIDGDYNNVIGLSVFKLKKMLKKVA